MRKAMPDVSEIPTYNNNTKDSYYFGYQFGSRGTKSLHHKDRLKCATEWDKGYAAGWKEYTEGEINKLLTGEIN